MKRNARISGNSGSGAPQNAQNAIKGSTMIAVLAAMLFIGIVTASMVKNTGSQSAASVGYGTMQTMSSTVKSGMVATETYFLTADSANTLALMAKALNADDNSPDRKPFIFQKDGKKTELGNNRQFFRSQLRDINKSSGKTYSRFEVTSGRTASGKALKKALAYYDMTETVNITNTAKYGAKNAVYMKGKLRDGNNGMEVFGSVTFEDTVTFQNTESIFHKDIYFNKGVNFEKNVTFKDKAYFNDYVSFQNMGSSVSMFDQSVGIRGNLTATNMSVGFGGNVWFNGVFKNDNNSKLISNGANNKFYYTDKLSMKTTAMCGMCPKEVNGHTPACVSSPNPNTNTCCPHNCSHDFDQSARIQSADAGGFVNMHKDSTSGYKGHSIDSATILQNLGMEVGGVEARRDPQLDITNIPVDKYEKTTLTNYTDAITLAQLNAMYAEASNNNALYNDHLVVKFSGGTPRFDAGSDIFDKKVIFVLENGAQLNGQYFRTTENSSTMIYVGQGDSYINNNFKLNGAFHGLIYIDEGNTATNYLSFGANDTLVGAIHSFSDKKLTWNTGNDAAPPVIKYDENVLNNFAGLLKNASSSNTWVTQYADTTYKHVRLKPFGYYFY